MPATFDPAPGLDIPVEHYALENGMRVVLSPDHTAPTAVAAVYYHVGFRSEPRGRSGFAHLFEHLMFQGSANLGKMEFIRLIQQNGGVLNGSTRFDFTNYFAVVPAHKLETVLWAEADRMASLDISEENLVNQRDVVKNEVRVNVFNQPYGGLGWLDLPQVAFGNWANAHNFYGDFTDLDDATLEDAREFFRTYYAPNNAVVVVTGDFRPAEARAWIARYFGPIPRGPEAPVPDVTEPPRTTEVREHRTDALASRPALTLGWRMPPRGTPAWWAMGLVDQILLQGPDSWFTRVLVRERGYTGAVGGGINLLGNMFNYDGPMLWAMSLIHDPETDAGVILDEMDRLVARLADEGPDDELLARARVKARSELYDTLGGFFGFGRADLLASLTLFDGAPGQVNELDARLGAVTAEEIRAAARDWLQPGQRTALLIAAGAPAAEAA